MQTNVDGVFAGGDVAMFPFPPRNNKKVNIPHWQMAHVHGECVTAWSSFHFYCLSVAIIMYCGDALLRMLKDKHACSYVCLFST